MISLYKLFRSLLPGNNIVVVKRLPAAKALRFHLLGLTLGFSFVLFYLIFGSPDPSWSAGEVIIITFRLI